jgi:1,4-dihydroxy-2-naphthoyl-CoA hydrolase
MFTTPDFPFETEIPYLETMDGVMGIHYESITDEEVVAKIPVHNGIRQEMGLVNGGAYTAVGESLASIPTLIAAHREGKTAVGMNNYATFLRPVREGTLHAHARRVAVLGRAWLWDIDFRDDAGELCAIVRVTVAITLKR